MQSQIRDDKKDDNQKDEDKTDAEQTPEDKTPAEDDSKEDTNSSAILTSIAIKTNLIKVEYETGESLDTTGLKVIATYDDETTRNVMGWTISGFDSSVEVEKQTITVSYTQGNVTKTATFDIKIKDITEGVIPWHYNNFYVLEKKTNYRIYPDKPLLNGQSYETSAVFPFVKKGQEYDFEYCFQLQAQDGYKILEYTIEKASCTAIKDGIDAAIYFDDDYNPRSTLVLVDEAGLMSVDKDVEKFIKKDAETIWMEGSIVAGNADWTGDTTWIYGWSSAIKSESLYSIDIPYDKLLAKNYDLGSEIKNYYNNLVSSLKARNTWFVNGTYYFKLKDIDAGFGVDLKTVELGKETSTNIFKDRTPINPDQSDKTWEQYISLTGTAADLQELPEPVGDNPFAGKYFKLPDTYDNENKLYKESLKFNEDRTGMKEQGNETTEIKYSWNTTNKMLYVQADKKNYPQYYVTSGSQGDVFKYHMYVMFNMIEEYYYAFDAAGNLNILPSELTSENIAKYFTRSVGDLGSFSGANNNKTVSINCEEIGFFNDSTQKIYMALGVNDNKIICAECNTENYSFGTVVMIPYTFNQDNKILTITVDSTIYNLSFGKPVIWQPNGHLDYDSTYWNLQTSE